MDDPGNKEGVRTDDVHVAHLDVADPQGVAEHRQAVTGGRLRRKR
jgi:hypothetical protein